MLWSAGRSLFVMLQGIDTGQPAQYGRCQQDQKSAEEIPSDIAHSARPVSYTHLDVYKRQMERFTSAHIQAVPESKAVVGFMSSI